MDLNILTAYREVQKVLHNTTSVHEGLEHLLKFSEQKCPLSIWGAIRSIDFSLDLAKIEVWINVLLSTFPPQADINAFWFGLTDSPTGKLYFTGTDTFKEDEDSVDCFAYSTYRPQNNVFESNWLRSISDLTSNAGSEVANFADYTLRLSYASLAIRQVFKKIPLETALGTGRSRTVVVGFNGGDNIRIGQLLPSGFLI